MIKKKTVGQKLRELRGNETQAQVAKEIGITVQALSNYENDFRTPRDETKKRIAEKYNKTVEEIFF